MVSARIQADQTLHDVIEKIGQVTKKLIEAVKLNSFDGNAIKENQRLLEELGVGRPATYAPTISTILSRGYVVLENKKWKFKKKCETGRVVLQYLIQV